MKLKKRSGKEMHKMQEMHEMKAGFSVYLKDEKGILPFSVKKGSVSETIKQLDVSQKQLEKFIRFIEKSMREAVWYIGTDIFAAGYYERFMFARNGFMEILLGKVVEIKAYFPLQERAKKFRIALEKALSRMLKEKAKQLIKNIR